MKGHKLKTSWSGVRSGYANGKCECGWVYPGWTDRMMMVRLSHGRHLQSVVDKDDAKDRKG